MRVLWVILTLPFQIWQDLLSAIGPKKPNPARISRLDDDGLTVVGIDVAWSAVKEITTCKCDLLAYDEVRVCLEMNDGSWVEIAEDDPRFDEFKTHLHRHYASIPADWYGDVCFPAYALNHRILWNGLETVSKPTRHLNCKAGNGEFTRPEVF